MESRKSLDMPKLVTSVSSKDLIFHFWTKIPAPFKFKSPSGDRECLYIPYRGIKNGNGNKHNKREINGGGSGIKNGETVTPTETLTGAK